LKYNNFIWIDLHIVPPSTISAICPKVMHGQNNVKQPYNIRQIYFNVHSTKTKEIAIFYKNKLIKRKYMKITMRGIFPTIIESSGPLSLG